LPALRSVPQPRRPLPGRLVQTFKRVSERYLRVVHDGNNNGAPVTGLSFALTLAFNI
jgi:hypothetical protein